MRFRLSRFILVCSVCLTFSTVRGDLEFEGGECKQNNKCSDATCLAGRIKDHEDCQSAPQKAMCVVASNATNNTVIQFKTCERTSNSENDCYQDPLPEGEHIVCQSMKYYYCGCVFAAPDRCYVFAGSCICSGEEDEEEAWTLSSECVDSVPPA